jgi:hypothetical protein
MEINWAVLAYILIGLFALSGFFKGWWKESITTYFLLFLVLLLYVPLLAQIFVASLNFIFALIAGILPDSWRIALADWLETGLGIPTVNGAIQLDPTNGGTWLVILIVFVGLGILLGRALLPNYFRKGVIYIPGIKASLLGALIGAFNGFLIVSLITAYLGSGPTTAAPESAGVLRAVAVPRFTLTESWIPWVFIIISLLVIVAALGNRVSITKDKEGYITVDAIEPLGHEKYEVTVK